MKPKKLKWLQVVGVIVVMLLASPGYASYVQTLSIAVEPRFNPKLAIFQLRFEAQPMPSFQVGAKGNVLSIKFNVPYQLSTATLASKLYPFVSEVRMGDNQKSLYLVAAKPVLMFEAIRDRTIAGVDLSFDKEGRAKEYPFDSVPQQIHKPTAQPKQETKQRYKAKPKSVNRDDGSAETAKLIKSSALPTYYFEWQQPVAMALFRRGDYSWIVFNRYKKIDTETVRQHLPDVVRVEQIANGNFTILRLRHGTQSYFQVMKDRFSWVVQQVSGPVTLAQPLRMEEEIDASGLFLGYRRQESGKGASLKIKDPDIGDVIVIMPLFEAGYGVASQRRSIDFTLLPTSQGVALISHHDHVAIKTEKGGYRVTSPSLTQMARPREQGQRQ